MSEFRSLPDFQSLLGRFLKQFTPLINEFLQPNQLRLYRCWHKGVSRKYGTTFYAVNRATAKKRFAAMYRTHTENVACALVRSED